MLIRLCGQLVIRWLKMHVNKQGFNKGCKATLLPHHVHLSIFKSFTSHLSLPPHTTYLTAKLIFYTEKVEAFSSHIIHIHNQFQLPPLTFTTCQHSNFPPPTSSSTPVWLKHIINTSLITNTSWSVLCLSSLELATWKDSRKLQAKHCPPVLLDTRYSFRTTCWTPIKLHKCPLHEDWPAVCC